MALSRSIRKKFLSLENFYTHAVTGVTDNYQVWVQTWYRQGTDMCYFSPDPYPMPLECQLIPRAKNSDQ